MNEQRTARNWESLWSDDFSTVSPRERRVARYVLQIVSRVERMQGQLKDNDDFLLYAWKLIMPLFNPARLAVLEAYGMGPAEGEPVPSAEGDPLLSGLAAGRMPAYLVEFFALIDDAVLQRLAAADGVAPTHVSVAVLAQCMGLSEFDTQILDFIEKKESVKRFRLFLREAGSTSRREHFLCLAAALDGSLRRVKASLQPGAPLCLLQLVRRPVQETDLEDFLAGHVLLENILSLEPSVPEELFEILLEPALAPQCAMTDFPHMEKDAARLITVLGGATSLHEVGVNALFYGAPGTGKTEFASVVAQAAGLQAFQVKTADNDGDGLSRGGRLGAYLMAQRLLRGRNDCVVVFDEIEDAFGHPENALFALFARQPRAGREKGWMNRTLEENPVPAIWITNDVSSMDPAFLRRFLLPVAFTTPPRRVRRQMIERHLGGTGVTSRVLDELAADAALVPAQFGLARRLLKFQNGASADEVVKEGVAAVRRLLHGSDRAQMRQPATAFDVAYLNLAGELEPARLGEALARTGRGSLCFYGPPGTGKTEFAHVLADALDRELVVRATSDLVSPYVGQTERNLADLFATIDGAHSILLLDEVDSLLRDRRQARNSWETTQVNELLQQMERFNGIFIAATNLIGQIDAAAMRRFDFKLHFRPLNRAQRLALFAREALGGEHCLDAIAPAVVARLDQLDMLTPGDFANVVRQRDLMGEALSPEAFLRRLIAEGRHKQAVQVAS